MTRDGGQMTLLVVEDNEPSREALSRRLARRGYAVVTAEDGLAGRRRWRIRPGPI